MTGKCTGSGVQVQRGHHGGGMRRANKYTCPVCGKRVVLTTGGRMPPHKADD